MELEKEHSIPYENVWWVILLEDLTILKLPSLHFQERFCESATAPIATVVTKKKGAKEKG